MNGRVLVVDDNEMNRDMLSRRVERQGHTVRLAKDGLEALAILRTEPIDLVLLDIMMPDMDGYELTRRIREQPRFHKLPILALTAKAMKGDREKCIAAGASDYLSKPINTDRLLSMLQVWLTKE